MHGIRPALRAHALLPQGFSNQDRSQQVHARYTYWRCVLMRNVLRRQSSSPHTFGDLKSGAFGACFGLAAWRASVS